MDKFLNFYYLAACLIVVAAVVGLFLVGPIVNFWRRFEKECAKYVKNLFKRVKRLFRGNKRSKRGVRTVYVEEPKRSSRGRRKNSRDSGHDYSFLDM